MIDEFEGRDRASLITERLASRSTIEDLRRERDEAVSYRYRVKTVGQDAWGEWVSADSDPHDWLWRDNWTDMQVEETIRAEAAERELAIVKEGGWKLVPVEPTEAMAEAGERARFEHTDQYFDGSEVSHGDVAEHIYRAMIAAAPLPPVPALNGDQE